jgi:hypothetical protein
VHDQTALKTLLRRVFGTVEIGIAEKLKVG